ncbi:hypothetical protein [Salinarimonas chemoclinalis]|uniref:hypothetical protein n=1 Tax=Salinarimonas chemoclinalis TaxID=3241599 RepID=UPI003556EC15
MTTLSIVKDAVAELTAAYQVGNRVIVPVLVTYPGGTMVQLLVEGGADTFVVSDGGGALRCYLAQGGQGARALRLLQEAARRHGVACNDDGWIFESAVDAGRLPSALSAVADASVRGAGTLLSHLRPRNVADFRPVLDRMIRSTFEGRVKRDAIVLGASNKEHRFDYALRVDDRRTVLIDAVLPDPSSINAAIVAHLDVRIMHVEDTTRAIVQKIIYDDRLEWSSADLALIRQGATPIAYSSIANDPSQIIA